MSNIAAITVPLRGTFAGSDHPFDTRYGSAKIHVGDNQQRPQILVPAVDKGDDE